MFCILIKTLLNKLKDMYLPKTMLTPINTIKYKTPIIADKVDILSKYFTLSFSNNLFSFKFLNIFINC